jgi:hypothetical protein
MHYLTICATIILVLAGNLAESQISTNLKPDKGKKAGNDTITAPVKPDTDRDDIPFIDYHPAIIWTSEKDTIHNYCYIRKNFTDQLLSVWNPSKRYYPASRIYAISVDGNYYRTVKVSPQNYVFAQQLVKGEINLYIYRKIPQVNGWVEVVSADPNNPGYTNYMVVEEKGMRGSRNLFGYYVSMSKDTSLLIQVQQKKLAEFAKNYLSETPIAFKEAMKYSQKNKNKTTAALVAGMMTFALFESAITGNDFTWIFLVGFPVMAVDALIRRSHTLHWDDMARIVNMHNQELSGKKDSLLQK